jgi:hypothetical protein
MTRRGVIVLRENYRRRGQATGNQGEMKVRFISPDHCDPPVADTHSEHEGKIR